MNVLSKLACLLLWGTILATLPAHAGKVDEAPIGVASKDLSVLIIDRIAIRNVDQAFTAYQKKPEYGGAQIYAKETAMINVDQHYVGDPQSRIFENGKAMKTSSARDLIN